MARKTLLLITTLYLTACTTPYQYICSDRVQFSSPQSIGFNLNEKILMCGDYLKESWNEIPLSQVEYQLKIFLNARAYYQPKFEYKNGKLLVDPGKSLVATSLEFKNAPEHFEEVKFRKIVGQPLTTELLNTVEAYTLLRLKNMGFACPTIHVEAIQETGAIHVFIRSGPNYHFDKPTQLDTIGMYPEALRRFDAFSESQNFHYDWMKLSEVRAENEGIVVGSQFIYTCPQASSDSSIPKLKIQQQVVAGEKRLITVGAGASTEEFPIGQITWKNVRTDENGSGITVNLYGSQRRQRAKGTYFWHPFKHAPRLHLDPAVAIERRFETNFQSTEIEAETPLAYQWDYANDSLRVSSGPSLKRNFSVDSGLEKAVTFLSYIADIAWFTHNFELYQGDPRSGSSLNFNTEVLTELKNFEMLGTILRFSGTHLIPLNPVYPHQWILGFRYGANTTLTNERAVGIGLIPAQYFHTLGGDQNLRGFSRNELTGAGSGARTSLFSSIEIRFAKTLPVWMEPFAFYDFGFTGNNSMSLESNFYQSPGLGIRVQSPFGVFRTTFAHGFVTPKPDPKLKREHFQFFLSFGKEF